MTTTYLLDTNMFSYIAKGTSPAARAEFQRLSQEGLFANFQILPWGSDEAAAYAQARALLEPTGLTVATMDMLIAAQAIAAGAVLVARDNIFGKMAKVVDLIDIVNWATDI